MCLALPYVIMVSGFSVLSYFMPVRDGITELSFSQICEKIFVTSIGPYWFIQTMIICGILYYISFKGGYLESLKQGKTTMSTTTSLFIFATPTLAGVQDTRSFAQCRSLLFHRYSNSPMPYRVWQDIPSFPCSLTALVQLAGLRGMVRLGMPGCNLLLLVLHFVIDVDT